MDVLASAMPVPDERDLATAARALAAAERAHDACYGWDVEVRSGARKGHLWGSGAGVGTRIGTDCERHAVLFGWIDPLARRQAATIRATGRCAWTTPSTATSRRPASTP